MSAAETDEILKATAKIMIVVGTTILAVLGNRKPSH